MAAMPPRPRRPARRRARGTGSIVRDGAGYRAEITLTPGAVPPEHRRRFAGETAYEEAAAWLDDLIARARGSRAVPRTAEEIPTVAEWMERWLTDRWGSLSSKAQASYSTSARRWIIPCLGSIRLDRLDRQDFQRFRDYLAATPGIRSTDASDRTAARRAISFDSQRTHWRILSAAMNAAVDEGVIPSHRMRPADSPRRTQQQRTVSGRERAMADDHLAAVMRTLASDRWACTPENHVEGRCRAMWLIRLGLAVRQGEAIAARWENVVLTGRDPHLHLDSHAVPTTWLHGCTWTDGDPLYRDRPREIDGRVVYACGRRLGRDCARWEERTGADGRTTRVRVVTRRDGGMVEKPGLKSRSPESSRTLALSPTQVDALRAHKRAQGGDLGRYVWGRDHLITPERDTASWDALLADAGVPHYRVHDARHTGLTIIAASMALADAQAVAGHASMSTTARYVHPNARRTRAGVMAASDHLDALTHQQ